METKRFTKNDSEFVCANCGARVEELGYTSRNHCPKCLCSLHLDLYPGDRAAGCGGIMDPVSAEPDPRTVESYQAVATSGSSATVSIPLKKDS